MFLKRVFFFAAVIAGALACSQIASAQDETQDSPPLSITTQVSSDLGAECHAGKGLVAQFRYWGTQPLRGYLVIFSFADSTTGKVLKEPWIRNTPSLKHPMIDIGAEWTETVCGPEKFTGDNMTVTARIDVLDFADGSIWGPASLAKSHELIGTLNGIDFQGHTTTQLERYVSPISTQRGPLPVTDVQTQTIGPLKIESGVWRDEHGQDLLAVDVTNESSFPIRAYLLTTSFFDPATGTRIRRFSTKELETHGNPADYLAPGATWVADPRKFSYLSDGTLASYKISVDLVAFADGSIFGPKKSAESDEVLGMLRGIDAANDSSRDAPGHR
jgi:hypothetical protein